MAEHETNLELITDDIHDTYCTTCNCIIPMSKPYFEAPDFHNGDTIDICVSCIKKCRDMVGRYEFEKKTYLV